MKSSVSQALWIVCGSCCCCCMAKQRRLFAWAVSQNVDAIWGETCKLVFYPHTDTHMHTRTCEYRKVTHGGHNNYESEHVVHIVYMRVIMLC